MHVSVLSSGSSGNSTFIQTTESNILVDAGISCRKIKNSLSDFGKELNELDAIFITHEHTDHIKGLERIHNKFEVPVYIHKNTYLASKVHLDNPNFFNNKITIKDLSIRPIPTSHDAANPFGYEIKTKKKTLGYFTDLGVYDDEVKSITNNADGLVLESNHDIDMVLQGYYPYHLKQRILGASFEVSTQLKSSSRRNSNAKVLAAF